MIRNIRKLLGFDSLFYTNDNFLTQYGRTMIDAFSFSGVTEDGTIVLSQTHLRLIQLAQEQGVLHRDFGLVRVLRLAEGTYYYDVGLKSIDGHIFSRGTSLRLDEAMARAFGELYERVAMKYVPEGEELQVASIKDLKRSNMSVIDLHSLPTHTEEQKNKFSQFRWDEHTVFSWVTSKNIFTGENVLVPAQFVYWGFKAKDEPILGPVTTHGLGGGYTQAGALSSAACEVIQRHSFFYHWYNNIAPRQIDLESIITQPDTEKDVKVLIEGVERYGLTLQLLDCTIEALLPSVAAVLTWKDGGLVMGMSTSTRYEKAIERSICEALSTYTWIMKASEKNYHQIVNEKEFESGFISPDIHATDRLFRWSKSIPKETKAFFRGPFVSMGSLISQQPQTIRGALATLSQNQACGVVASKPYLQTVGFNSARVIVPHAYKLSLTEHHSVPVLDGAVPKNTYPHPFP